MRIHVSAALALIAIGVAAPQSARAGYMTDLAGYYHFDGDGADSSGNSRNLTLVGNPGFAAGLFGQALDLHRDNGQYATRTIDDTAFNLQGDSTVQVWINYNSTSGEQALIQKYIGDLGPGWIFGKLSNNSYAPIGPTSPILDLAAGVWHSLVVRHSGDNHDFFVDGVNVSSQGGVGSPSITTNPLLIGRMNAEDGRDFSLDGRLDEIAIWNRALSDSEISGLYNGGQGLELSAAIPEPSSFAMIAVGTLMVGGFARHRSKPKRPGTPLLT